MSDVVLRAYAEGDVELTLELETDAATMAELGGARDRDAVLRAHANRVGERYAFTIERDGDPVGFIGAWRSKHDGEPMVETGWTLLPRVHRRGVASAAVGLLLERLREDGDVTELHAFPGVTNVASNKLCDHFGFDRRGVVPVDFGGAALTCEHRVLAL